MINTQYGTKTQQYEFPKQDQPTTIFRQPEQPKFTYQPEQYQVQQQEQVQLPQPEERPQQYQNTQQYQFPQQTFQVPQIKPQTWTQPITRQQDIRPVVQHTSGY